MWFSFTAHQWLNSSQPQSKKSMWSRSSVNGRGRNRHRSSDHRMPGAKCPTRFSGNSNKDVLYCLYRLRTAKLFCNTSARLDKNTDIKCLAIPGSLCWSNSIGISADISSIQLFNERSRRNAAVERTTIDSSNQYVHGSKNILRGIKNGANCSTERWS